MRPIETTYATPTVRVQLYPDHDCSNPLEWWDHGIQFVTLPNHSRTWSDYAEPTSNGIGLDIEYPERFREFYTGEYDSDVSYQQSPSLRRYLNTHTAAWCTIDRDGYNGDLNYDFTHDDIEDSDAIAYVSREELRSWHMVSEGKRMPRNYRQKAEQALRGVLDEYNKWATGDVYGYQVEEHNPACPYCEDASEPDDGCVCWDDTDDSCWGFIGYEYAQEEVARIVASYQTDPAKERA